MLGFLTCPSSLLDGATKTWPPLQLLSTLCFPGMLCRVEKPGLALLHGTWTHCACRMLATTLPQMLLNTVSCSEFVKHGGAW